MQILWHIINGAGRDPNMSSSILVCIGITDLFSHSMLSTSRVLSTNTQYRVLTLHLSFPYFIPGTSIEYKYRYRYEYADATANATVRNIVP